MRAPTPETIRQAGEALIAGMRDGSIRKRGGKLYKPSTIRSYEASLNEHVYPQLGASKTADVLFPDLQDFVDRLAASGLEGQTIRNTVNPLRVVYRRARYHRPVNPTTGLEIPAGRNKPKRAVPADDVARRMEALREYPEDRAIWAVMFYAGLRTGESRAFPVENVELFPAGGWGVIHVRDGWDKVEGRIDPKSDAGVRTVPVPEQLFTILSERVPGSGLAFGQGETPWSYSAVRERAERVWKKAGIQPYDLRFHEARHTYRTLLADAGIPRDRRDRYTGHSDASVGGRYEHQLDAQYLDDARTFSDYLRRADTPARLRDRCATVRDTLERFPAVSGGTKTSDENTTEVGGNPHHYAETRYSNGGGGI
jgi:integrase